MGHPVCLIILLGKASRKLSTLLTVVGIVFVVVCDCSQSELESNGRGKSEGVRGTKKLVCSVDVDNYAEMPNDEQTNQ